MKKEMTVITKPKIRMTISVLIDAINSDCYFQII